MKSAIFYIDGGSRGNPGEAGYGIYVLGKDDQALAEIYGYLGIQTNNFAEYQGLLEALKFARKLNLDSIEIRSDSELLVRQIQGSYRVKSPTLKPLHEQAKRLIAGIKQFSIKHVRREMNKEADRLANEAMDTRKTAAYIPPGE